MSERKCLGCGAAVEPGQPRIETNNGPVCYPCVDFDLPGPGVGACIACFHADIQNPEALPELVEAVEKEDLDKALQALTALKGEEDGDAE